MHTVAMGNNKIKKIPIAHCQILAAEGWRTTLTKRRRRTKGKRNDARYVFCNLISSFFFRKSPSAILIVKWGHIIIGSTLGKRSESKIGPTPGRDWTNNKFNVCVNDDADPLGNKRPRGWQKCVAVEEEFVKHLHLHDIGLTASKKEEVWKHFWEDKRSRDFFPKFLRDVAGTTNKLQIP